MERNLAALENSAHADSERLAALVALVEAHAGALALHLADTLDAAAMRASWFELMPFLLPAIRYIA